MKEKAILVTGGTGFLGSHLVRHLVTKTNDRVLVVKRSFSSTVRLESIRSKLRFFDADKENLGSMFEEYDIDLVIHCATNYGRKSELPSEIAEANTIFPLKILELVSQNGTKTFINCDTILERNVSPYALAKKQFSEWLQNFSSKLTCVDVVLQHFFGADDDPSKFISHVTREIIRGADFIKLTKGDQKRDFIYIDDVVKAMDFVIKFTRACYREYLKYEVGSGKEVSVREFVELIKRLTGNDRTRLDFGALPYRDHEAMRSVADIRAISALGWEPKITLEEGLMRMIHSVRTEKASS